MRTTHPICPDQTRRYGHRPGIRGRKRLFHSPSRNSADGKVIGIDFSPQMLAKARANAAKRGCDNVEFREGDIETCRYETTRQMSWSAIAF